MKKHYEKILGMLRFDSRGLIPAVVQDFKNKQVLMVAYMNKKALVKTLDTGKAHYWSRSRNKLWMKGETSGHIQKVKEIAIDCDSDSILLRVDQKVAACHEGYRSCFFRKLKGGKLVISAKKVKG